VNRLKGLEAGESVNLEDILPMRQNCFGDTNNEEAFNPTRWFCVYLHRKGYRYCRSVEGLPVKVISSGKSYKVFEQYPWEGHSSKYGPKGNRLNSSYGVGVGKNISRSLQVRQGDWIHMPDIGWRQINEFSSKKDGIEFFATHREEYKGKHPRIAIDRVVFALPSQRPDHAP